MPIFGSPHFAELGCAALSDFFSSNNPSTGIPKTSPYTFIGASNPADGCLGIESVPSGSSTQKADYLYRFGGLIALNDLAHRLTPFWPVASAHERQIAAAILASSTPAT